MSLARKLAEYVEACFPGLWIVSSEPEEALREIARLAHQREWSLAVWDIDQGWQHGPEGELPDPLAAVRTSAQMTSAQTGLAVLVHFRATQPRMACSAEGHIYPAGGAPQMSPACRPEPPGKCPARLPPKYGPDRDASTLPECSTCRPPVVDN